MIKLDLYSYTKKFYNQKNISSYYNKTRKILDTMKQKESMLDWFDIDSTISKNEIDLIKKLTSEISKSDALITIGIGGSFLGAKAVIDAFTPYLTHKKPEVIFAGFDLSAEFLEEVIEYIKSHDVYVNVISKSGNTLEPNIAFNLILEHMKKKYKSNWQQRIIVTTDANHGILHDFVVTEKVRSLVVPDNIGGRYSVLSPVGLLPISVAGVNIDKLLKGAKNGKNYIDNAIDFACARDIMFRKKMYMEAVTFYEAKLNSFADWYIQLFAETQGKNHSGILPFNNHYTTNLHSIGQYLQDGTNMVFETVLKVSKTHDIFDKSHNVSLNNLTNMVVDSVAIAHVKGNTPSIIIELDELTSETIGELIYFCFISAAVGGYLLKINPFDQPGVEEYKKQVNSKLVK